jgi:hypothetical protein
MPKNQLNNENEESATSPPHRHDESVDATGVMKGRDEEQSLKNKTGPKLEMPINPKPSPLTLELEEARKAMEEADLVREEKHLDMEEAQSRFIVAQGEYSDANQEYEMNKQLCYELELKQHCQWNHMYNLLLEYKETYGDTLVPHRRDDYHALGRWVANQRVFYKMHLGGKTGHIRPSRIEALNRIGFCWNLNDHRWNLAFERCKKAIEEKNGDANEIYDKTIRTWTDTNQKQYMNFIQGLPNQMTKERIKKLDEIGLVSFFRKKLEQDQTPSKKRKFSEAASSSTDLNAWWERGFTSLKTFHEKHGHCFLSLAGSRSHRQLVGSEFVDWNREQYTLFQKSGKEKEQCKLTAVLVQRLNEIDFEWDTSNEWWERGFQAVKEFRAEHGHCLLSIVDNKIVKRGRNEFVFWNREQYVLYQQTGNAKEECKLTATQVRRLDDIGFEWDHKVEVQIWWDHRFDSLCEYHSKFGDTRMDRDKASTQGKANCRLRDYVSWSRKQYKLYQKGDASSLMTEEMIEKMDRIAFEWAVSRKARPAVTPTKTYI